MILSLIIPFCAFGKTFLVIVFLIAITISFYKPAKNDVVKSTHPPTLLYFLNDVTLI